MRPAFQGRRENRESGRIFRYKTKATVSELSRETETTRTRTWPTQSSLLESNASGLPMPLSPKSSIRYAIVFVAARPDAAVEEVG